jgi:hypothetical protein
MDCVTGLSTTGRKSNGSGAPSHFTVRCRRTYAFRTAH